MRSLFDVASLVREEAVSSNTVLPDTPVLVMLTMVSMLPSSSNGT